VFDHEKASAARVAKAAEKQAAGLELNWTRKRAILAWCHQCMNNQPSEVRNCGNLACPLWPFRSRHSVSAKEMKCWEGRFRESADGRRFLKENDGGDTPQAGLPDEKEW
jgi:hypothetical protein